LKNSQHVGLWWGVAVIAFLVTPLWRSGESMDGFVREEIAVTRMAMGDTVGNMVVSFADAVFHHSPLTAIADLASSGKNAARTQTMSRRIMGPVAEMASRFSSSYLQGLIQGSYIVAIRLAICLVWIAVLLPIFFAAVFDGLMLRAIKRAEFGAMRPATFTLASILVIPLLNLPLIYLVIPFTISPLLAPFWAAAIALPLSLLVSNSQPLFGR